MSKPQITLTHFGVTGTGETVKAAKQDAGHKIETLIRDISRRPTIIAIEGYASMIYRTPDGWASAIIHDRDGCAGARRGLIVATAGTKIPLRASS
jgi:hypothetical protein